MNNAGEVTRTQHQRDGVFLAEDWVAASGILPEACASLALRS